MVNNRSHRMRRSRGSLALFLIGGLLAVSIPVIWFATRSSDANTEVAAAPTQSSGRGDVLSERPTQPPTPLLKKPHPKPSPSATRAPNGGTRTSSKCPGYPTPECTGVPAGTKLTPLALNVDGDTYRVTTPGTVLQAVHIPGNLLITANNVTIKNSEVDGFVQNEYGTTHYSFTITDSTVGKPNDCGPDPAIGEANFTAARVHVRGQGDGFRDSGDNINIQDSYVRLCSKPGFHSDGIQSYKGGKGLVFNHNTIDQRNVQDWNAPIFLGEDSVMDIAVTNNLVMGGTFSIQVKKARGRVVVQNNRLVDKSWAYGPDESTCANIAWSGNTLVTIDSGYRITSTVAPLPCIN